MTGDPILDLDPVVLSVEPQTFPNDSSWANGATTAGALDGDAFAARGPAGSGGHDTRYVVRVEDLLDARLANRAATPYASPPQPREQARELASLILDGNLTGSGAWWRAIAGGRRTITIQALDE